MFKDLQVVGETLEKISSLESYQVELEGQIQKLKVRADEARAGAEDAEKTRKDVIASLTVEQHQFETAKVSRAHAQRKTDELITELKRKSDAFTEDVKAAYSVESKALELIKSDVRKARDELEKLNEEIQVKRDALAVVSGRK